MKANLASLQPNNINSQLNVVGYAYICRLSMIYIAIMLCNAVLTNRYIGTDNFFLLGGTLTSPFIFILDDIIAEVYGFTIAKNIIFSGFAAQCLFVLICYLATIAPSPTFFNKGAYYYEIFGPSLIRITLSGFAAYIIANLINSYVLTKWKILLKGKYFWLRSIGSSSFSEALYTFMAIMLMEINQIPLSDILKVATTSFIIKLTYSVVFAFPANYLVDKIKIKTGIDIYELPKIFTPFK